MRKLFIPPLERKSISAYKRVKKPSRRQIDNNQSVQFAQRNFSTQPTITATTMNHSNPFGHGRVVLCKIVCGNPGCDYHWFTFQESDTLPNFRMSCPKCEAISHACSVVSRLSLLTKIQILIFLSKRKLILSSSSVF